MSVIRLFSIALLSWLVSSGALAQTAIPRLLAQPVGGAPLYANGPLAGQPFFWSPDDEAWFLRNRRIAMAGKIMTVVGIVSVLASAAVDSDGVNGIPLLVTGAVVQQLGQISWSIAELRAALRMQRRGIDISRASGITAVIGAFTVSPLVWIAGPIQSARLRNTHETLALSPSATPGLSAWGTGLRYTF